VVLWNRYGDAPDRRDARGPVVGLRFDVGMAELDPQIAAVRPGEMSYSPAP
jgi:hypothetical protein